jgi:hypothetical protein
MFVQSDAICSLLLASIWKKACDVQHVLVCRTSAYWMAIRKVPFICSPYMFLSNGDVALVGSCADITGAVRNGVSDGA